MMHNRVLEPSLVNDISERPLKISVFDDEAEPLIQFLADSGIEATIMDMEFNAGERRYIFIAVKSNDREAIKSQLEQWRLHKRMNGLDFTPPAPQ